MIRTTPSVPCLICGVLVVDRGEPTSVYDQLVITMQTPEGACSTHEMLMCSGCRQGILTRGIEMLALDVLYQRDVDRMVRAHVRAKGISPESRKSAEWMRAHVPVAVRADVGSSVAMLRNTGRLV